MEQLLQCSSLKHANKMNNGTSKLILCKSPPKDSSSKTHSQGTHVLFITLDIYTFIKVNGAAPFDCFHTNGYKVMARRIREEFSQDLGDGLRAN